jgi:hypothetical protein
MSSCTTMDRLEPVRRFLELVAAIESEPGKESGV